MAGGVPGCRRQRGAAEHSPARPVILRAVLLGLCIRRYVPALSRPLRCWRKEIGDASLLYHAIICWVNHDIGIRFHAGSNTHGTATPDPVG